MLCSVRGPMFRIILGEDATQPQIVDSIGASGTNHGGWFSYYFQAKENPHSNDCMGTVPG